MEVKNWNIAIGDVSCCLYRAIKVGVANCCTRKAAKVGHGTRNFLQTCHLGVTQNQISTTKFSS